METKLEQWMNWILYDQLVSGQINAPKHVLGNHDYGKGQVITVFRPHADNVKITSVTGKSQMELIPIGDQGVYGIYIPKKKFEGTKYRVVTTYQDGSTVTTADPYSFASVITDFDKYCFSEGKHYDIYNKLGAHPMKIDGVQGTYFAVWAPHAKRVSVVGDFNMWDGNLHQMQILEACGIYELFIPGVEPGALYKFEILSRFDELIYKSDPYGNACQFRPETASIVTNLDEYKWKDAEWVEKRNARSREDRERSPMAIYECHLGSWKKVDEDSDDGYYTYRDLAPMLGDYLKDMGYTHVELMGIAEYPFDGSWGYQVTGYYAPTSRYGSPQDFMYFVDYMHKLGIQVILDWVPAHFPRDAHGLGRFDGMPLYEHPDPRKGEHPDWGTYIFDYGYNQVSNFLIANALFWVEKYHIDGLRVDAVASMLYLDYGKQDGQWCANQYGGNENLEAIALLQNLNHIMEERNPGAYIIAEESTAWPNVTNFNDNGLGFSFKWNMGWMHDFLEYMKLDPYFRSFNHHRLTFSLMYAYSEKFVLVLSHDEVVHLKCSMINKMPGDMPMKFANLKTAMGFMYGHPGKKLLFMGQEFAQLREWSEARSIDWYLLEDESHKRFQNYMRDLNHLYNKYDAFYYNDYDVMGFEWISCDDAQTSVVSFIRRGKSAKNQLLFVCNFTPVEHSGFKVGVPCAGKYTEVLNSDAEQYGGENRLNAKALTAQKENINGREYAITMELPPLSTVVFQYDYKESAETGKTKGAPAKKK
ncbi:MAG: 1,4-alpha-glucan branching protein GlgB [Lachnospiraceae bacterium]|nr:1,4-alpha-glucan branching protein GlgB [Lachnospiraceae bacterium]